MKLDPTVILSEREPKGFERVEGSPEFSGDYRLRKTLRLRGIPQLASLPRDDIAGERAVNPACAGGAAGCFCSVSWSRQAE